MKSCRDGYAHGNIYGLIDGMLLGQRYGTVIGYEVIVVDGEVLTPKVELEI